MLVNEVGIVDPSNGLCVPTPVIMMLHFSH